MNEIVNENAHFFSADDIIQGKRFYLNSNVTPAKNGLSFFSFNVKDGTKEETTTLFVINKKLSKVFCTCGKCTTKHYCSHVYASLLKYDDKVSEEKNKQAEQRKSTAEIKKKAKEAKLNPLAKSIGVLIRGEDYRTSTEIEKMISSYIHEGFDFGADFSKIRKVYVFSSLIDILERNEEIACHVFSKCDFSLIPQSTNINSIGDYLAYRPMKAALLSENSIHGLFSNTKINETNKSRLLSLGMSLNRSFFVSSFLNDCNLIPDFFLDITILNYMKKNIPEGEYTSFFKERIKSNRLTAQEFFFLYPHMDENTRQDYVSLMPKDTVIGSGFYYYAPDESQDPYAFTHCPISKRIYGLIESRNLLSFNKLITYYYAIPFIKKEELRDIVGRFRLLASAKSKKSNTGDIFLYCILSFCLAFYQERSDLVQFVENIAEIMDEDYHPDAVWTLFFECQEKMHLTKKEKYRTYEIKEEKENVSSQIES